MPPRKLWPRKQTATIDQGLNAAIEKAGGVRRLAVAIGISAPAVGKWRRVPAERLPAVSAVTGIPREKLRPDLARLFVRREQ